MTKESKCFEKSEEWTIDDRHCNVFLPEQKPVSS